MKIIMRNIAAKQIGAVDIIFRSNQNLFNKRNLKSVSKTTQANILDLMFTDD
jgi:hypothetical protein